MQKGVIALIVLVAVVAIGLMVRRPAPEDTTAPSASDTASLDTSATITESATDSIKEFAMDSFVVFEDGKPKPQYSLREITAEKGDRVRLTVTVTAGNHDFNIDEFNVHAETPLNEPTVIEFDADQVGTFTYYCSKPGHRAAGHWGTLTVTE